MPGASRTSTLRHRPVTIRRAVAVLLAPPLLAIAPRALPAQVVLFGDAGRVVDLVECGASDSPPGESVRGRVFWSAAAAAGAVAGWREGDRVQGAAWQAESELRALRGCHRSPVLRVQAFGYGAVVAGRAEILVPLFAFATAPRPLQVDAFRRARVALVAGAETTPTEDVPGFELRDQGRAWVGTALATPALTFGWAGEARLSVRPVVTAQLDLRDRPGDDQTMQPRLGVAVPLPVQRGRIVGLLYAYDRASRWRGDDAQVRHSLAGVLSLALVRDRPLALVAEYAYRRVGTIGEHALVAQLRVGSLLVRCVGVRCE